MGADHFCDKRIERPNERASRVVIMRARSFDQRAQIRFFHVASTPGLMTDKIDNRLRISFHTTDAKGTIDTTLSSWRNFVTVVDFV
ncbi:MAG: hypothetical protein QOG48_471 [Verrucomicrobiota bacterium]